MSSEHEPGDSYHTYESSAVPWWIVALWIAYFIFGFSYLLINLLGE